MEYEALKIYSVAGVWDFSRKPETINIKLCPVFETKSSLLVGDLRGALDKVETYETYDVAAGYTGLITTTQYSYTVDVTTLLVTQTHKLVTYIKEDGELANYSVYKTDYLTPVDGIQFAFNYRSTRINWAKRDSYMSAGAAAIPLLSTFSSYMTDYMNGLTEPLITAVTTSLSPIFDLPYPLNPALTLRQQLLTYL